MLLKFLRKRKQLHILRLALKVATWTNTVVPDQQIGYNYLKRWYVARVVKDTPEKFPFQPHTFKNRFFNLYVHYFTGSDDDRALHDHPAWNCSVVLFGSYKEVTKSGAVVRVPGDFVFRRGRTAHRLELIDNEPVLSLFFMWRKTREWGFHCPKGRWVHWKVFTDYDKTGNGNHVGRGCE